MGIPHVIRLVALPFFVFPFLLGWVLYYLGPSKNQKIAKRVAKYAEDFDLRFGLLMQEEQYAK